MVKSVIKNIVNILLMLLLTLLLFIFGIFVVVNANCTNADFYIQLMDKAQKNNGFYDKIFEDAEKIFEYRGTLSALPEEVFDGILTKDYIIQSSREYVRAVVDGNLDEFTLHELRQTVFDRIHVYLLANPSNITEGEIESFCDFLDGEMIQATKLPFFAKIYPSIDTMFKSGIRVLVPVTATVLLAAIIMGLYFLSDRKSVITIRNVAISVLGCVLMTGIISGFLWLLDSSVFFNFSTDVVLYYLDELKKYLAMGITCLTGLYFIFGICLIWVTYKKKGKLK